MRSCLFMALVTLASLGVGCDAPVDPRYETPRATIGSLLASYGIEDTPEHQVQAMIARGGELRVRDQGLHDGAFADLDEAHDEGSAGWIFGRLAAAKEHLEFQVEGDHATVFTRTEGGRMHQPVHLVRRNGSYRISIEETVPTEVQERFALLYARHARRLGR